MNERPSPRHASLPAGILRRVDRVFELLLMMLAYGVAREADKSGND